MWFSESLFSTSESLLCEDVADIEDPDELPVTPAAVSAVSPSSTSVLPRSFSSPCLRRLGASLVSLELEVVDLQGDYPR